MKQSIKSTIKLLLLFVTTIILIAACNSPVTSKMLGSHAGARNNIVEVKQYSDATIEHEFAGDSILVVLNKEATFSFKNYTSEDFSEINSYGVTELTGYSKAIVIKQLNAEKSGDWKELQEWQENSMLINLDEYRAILKLDLGKESTKENALSSIKKL